MKIISRKRKQEVRQEVRVEHVQVRVIKKIQKQMVVDARIRHLWQQLILVAL